jgi:hypothetical protein
MVAFEMDLTVYVLCMYICMYVCQDTCRIVELEVGLTVCVLCMYMYVCMCVYMLGDMNNESIRGRFDCVCIMYVYVLCMYVCMLGYM